MTLSAGDDRAIINTLGIYGMVRIFRSKAVNAVMACTSGYSNV
jgi:hypothetical protein